MKEIYILLFLVSFVFLLWVVTDILSQINRKKGIVALVLSLIFSFITGYHIYFILYEKPIALALKKYEKAEKVIIKPKIEEKKPSKIFLVLKINDENIKVGIEEEIEVKKSTNFIITDIEGIDKENLKINFVGFVPKNKKYNDGQDMGYKINYKDLRRDKEIDKDKYLIEIKKDDKKIGSIYVKFID